MKYKRINIALTLFSLTMLICLLVIGSYAIFSTTISPNKVHIITVGNLYRAKADITDNGVISLTNAVPLSNDIGLKGDSTKISLTNVGNISMAYSIVLIEDKAAYNSDQDTTTNILPSSVIKYGVLKEPLKTTNINLLSQSTEYCSDDTLSMANCAVLSNEADYGHVIMTGRIAIGESVDYNLKLWITQEAGNEYQNRHYHGQIKIIIGNSDNTDVNPPTIIMNGDDEITINTNDNYNDPGILAAIDLEDGDIIDSLETSSTVNTAVPGIYYVRYAVHDSSGYYAYATRTVIVKNKSDDCGITFTLNGANPFNIYIGYSYNDPGATAVDSNNNGLTVTTTSVGLDTSTQGRYQVVYSATANSCTEYTYRVVNVLMGANTFMVYNPNGTDNVWSSNNVTTNISIAENVPYIVPQTLKYKIGTIGNDNAITYGNLVTATNMTANQTFNSSGKYLISSTIEGEDNVTLSDLNSKQFFIDKTAPSCGTITGASTTWTKENRTISVGCSDEHSGCSSATFQKVFNETSNTNGTSAITISDKASPNANTTTCTVNAYVDKTLPECGTITGASTTWAKGTRTISVGCSDTHSNCPNETVSYTFPNTFSGSIGQISIADNATNTKQCPVNVYLDNGTPTAPTITGTIASDIWAQTNTLTISGGSSLSGITGYQYCESATNSYSSCTWNPYDSNNKPTYTTEGITYVFARAINTVGTSGTPTAAYIVKIDTTNPSCTLTVTTSGVKLPAANRLDNNGVTEFGMNKTGTAVYDLTATVALSNGTFYGYVKDQAGNYNQCSATLSSTKRTCRTSAYQSANGSCSTSGVATCSDSSWTPSGICTATKKWKKTSKTCNCTGYPAVCTWGSASSVVVLGATCPTPCASCTAGGNVCVTSCTLQSTTWSGSITCSRYYCSTGQKSGNYCYLYNQTSCGSWSIYDYTCSSGTTELNDSYCYVIN